MKKISLLCLSVVLTILLCGCAANGDKLVGKWSVGDDVYEFTDDGKFVDLYNSDTAGYYKVMSNKKIAIFPDVDMKEDPVIIPYSFKKDKLYLGDLEYIPFVDKDEKKEA